MSDSDLLSVRGKAGLARGAPAEVAGAPPEAGEGECAAFGYLRGVRERADSVEFRFANGNRLAFPYTWLGPAWYDPSAGLLLKFVGDLAYYVLVEGSNLNRPVNGSVTLYDRGILRHRVTWVREMTRAELAGLGEGEVAVERVRFAACRADEEPRGVSWLAPFLPAG